MANGGDRPGVRPLPDEATSELQGDGGGVAWSLRAPGEARPIVEASKVCICGVRVLRIEAAPLEREATALIPREGLAARRFGGAHHRWSCH